MSAHHRFLQKYGPWAVVTGASDGIGRAMARWLAEAGLHVVLVARRRGRLEEDAARYQAEHRVQTRIIAADLATLGGVEQVEAETAGLEVGLLVAAAGYGTSGSFLDAEPSVELDMLDVNCRATLLLAQHFGQRFARQGRGGLVLMGSLVGFQGVAKAAHYAATKAYVQTLAEGLHLELAPFGVDVLASAPGPIRSGFAARANMQMGLSQGPEVVAAATLRALGRQMTVRPGWVSKLLEAALTLPRPWRARIMKLVMGGMTQHQALGPGSGGPASRT
jgi:short-subunit dehydrogenase